LLMLALLLASLPNIFLPHLRQNPKPGRVKSC
jgi:hypothetical protein